MMLGHYLVLGDIYYYLHITRASAINYAIDCTTFVYVHLFPHTLTQNNFILIQYDIYYAISSFKHIMRIILPHSPLTYLIPHAFEPGASNLAWP